MSALAIPEDSAVLDSLDDPGAFCIAALDRAKSWLAQAQTTDLPELVDAKARAEALRCYVAQKELGKDAELAAAEIVRRAERRIGQLVREGQANGEIRKQREGGGRPSVSGPKPGPETSTAEFFSNRQERTDTYAMTDGVSDDEFEEAIGDAKDEGNMARANVVRKTVMQKIRRGFTADERAEQIRTLAEKGHNARQIAEKTGLSLDRVRFHAKNGGITLADEVIGKTRRHDSNRIVAETVSTLAGAAMGADLVNYEALDRSQIEGWVISLNDSMKALARLHKQLREMSRD